MRLAPGRISNLGKAIDGNTYTISYGYNLASELTSLTYPSGRVVNQSYDAVGRMNQIASSGTNYLSGMTYNSASLPTGFNYGNGVAASFSYNTRLELSSLSYVKGANTLLSLTYAYGTSNNGQIATITDNQDASKSMTYSYDVWARLSQATAGPTGSPTWKLGFLYDRYGNRTQQNLLAGAGFATQTPTDPVTNRLLSPNVYDAAGNLTNDTTHTYTYDAENRLKQVDGGATATYTYDGGPLRVKKVASGLTTVYIYSGSKVIAEYVVGAGLMNEYVYAGDTLLVRLRYDGVVTYHHRDHLSSRVQTDGSGELAWLGGHYPFGETWYEAGPASQWKFTSYERDSESQLDYAIFRNYSSRLGRFAQADSLAGSASNPQSLNRDSYVGNDPANHRDPLGLTRNGGDSEGLLLPVVGWCNVDMQMTPCTLVSGLLFTGAAAAIQPQSFSGIRVDEWGAYMYLLSFTDDYGLSYNYAFDGPSEFGSPFGSSTTDDGLSSLRLEPYSDRCTRRGREIDYKIIGRNGGRVLGDYYIHEIIMNAGGGVEVGESERNGFSDIITLGHSWDAPYTVVQMFRIATSPSAAGIPISIQRAVNGRSVTLPSQTILRAFPTIRVAGTRGDNCE